MDAFIGDILKSGHCFPATDLNTPILGDWTYIENYNYSKVINDDEFQKKGWVPAELGPYSWSGENLFCAGGANFCGLGLEEKEAPAIREKLVGYYNIQLAKVIDAKGKIDGVLVTELDNGPESIVKLPFKNLYRVHNKLSP